MSTGGDVSTLVWSRDDVRPEMTGRRMTGPSGLASLESSNVRLTTSWGVCASTRCRRIARVRPAIRSAGRRSGLAQRRAAPAYDRRGFASTEPFRVVDAVKFRDAMLFHAVNVWSEAQASGHERFVLSTDGEWPDVADVPHIDPEIGFPLVVASHLPVGEIAVFYCVFQEIQPPFAPRVGGYCLIVDHQGLREGSRLDDALSRHVHDSARSASANGTTGSFS